METVTPSVGSPRRNRTAVASLVASIVSLAGLGSILGMGLGVYALNQIAVTGEGGRGLALAGIVVGALTLLVSMIVLVKGLGEW